MASTDARPVPQKNVAYRHYFAIRKNDGTLITTWAGQDSERSLDGATFADCTNEATEIGTTGCGYIDLTAAEMNTDATMLKVTVTNTDALDYVVTLFPEDAGDIRTNMTQVGGQTASAAAAVDFDDITELQTVLSAGILGATNNQTLIEQLQTVTAIIEHQRDSHTHQPIGNIFFVDPTNGATHASGARGGVTDPYATIQDCHDNAVTDSNHDCIILLSGAAAGATTHTVAATTTLSKRYLFVRGPGRDFIVTRTGSGDTIEITADGIELSGFQVGTAATGSGNGVTVTSADFFKACGLWFNNTQGDAIELTDSDNFIIHNCNLQATGQSGSGHGIQVLAGNSESSNYGSITDNYIHDISGDGIQIDTTGGGACDDTKIQRNTIEGCTDDGVDIVDGNCTGTFISDNRFGNNTSNDIEDAGTTTITLNNEQWGTGGAGGDATEANQTTIIDHLTDVKGPGWTTTDALEAIRNQGDAAWVTATGFSTLVASDIVSDGTAINTTAGVVDQVTLTVTSTNNTDMRGTDSAALASVVTESRMSELDAATGGKMANQVDSIAIDTSGIAPIASTQGTHTTLLNTIDSNTETLPAGLADVPTVAEFNARTLLASAYFDPAVDTVASVTLVDTLTTYTGNTPQTADHTAGIAALPTLAEMLAGGDVDGYTIEETLKLCLSALAGVLAGAAGTSITIEAADGSKTRITATVDGNGNRSAVVLDATG